MQAMKKWLALSAILLVVSGCSQSNGPTVTQIQNALHDRAQQVLGGCPLFDYSQLKIESQKAADDNNGSGRHVVAVVDYQVNSLMKGHKFNPEHPPAQRPAWFPAACSKMFSAANPAAQQRMVGFIQNEFDHSGSTVLDAQSFGAFMFGQITLDVSRVSLGLDRDKGKWVISGS